MTLAKYVTLLVLVLKVILEVEGNEMNPKMEPFIVGGAIAKIENFAHAAFLAIGCDKKTGTEHFSCGSSIINQYILLTAAHCLEECLPSSSVLVAVGVVDRKGPFTHEAGHFVMHPRYDGDIVVNDICLIAVTRPLKFGAKVKRVVLMNKPPYREVSTVAGWGLENEQVGTVAQFLKEAKQMYVNRKQCVKILHMLNKGTFCVTGIKKSRDYGYAASGDSGSAIVVRDFIQIGLVSYKIPQFSASVIGATDVGYFYPWIRTNAEELICQIKDGQK